MVHYNKSSLVQILAWRISTNDNPVHCLIHASRVPVCQFVIHVDAEYSLATIIKHYTDVIMGAMASQITSLTIVYLSVYSGRDQRKHQSSASLAFVLGIHRWPVNSPQKWPVTRKMFPFDDVIMSYDVLCTLCVMWHRETNSFTLVPPQYKDSLSVYGDSHCRYTAVISF